MDIPVKIAIYSVLVGFAIHLIMKYWGEDGKFADNFLSPKTLRYVVITALTLTAGVIGLYYASPELQAIIGLGSLGVAGGSMTANGQRISDKSRKL